MPAPLKGSGQVLDYQNTGNGGQGARALPKVPPAEHLSLGNQTKTWTILLGVGAIVVGALVAFTDVEIHVVRWVSCGPFSTQGEDRSELCR
jgi:hypothetical protein